MRVDGNPKSQAAVVAAKCPNSGMVTDEPLVGLKRLGVDTAMTDSEDHMMPGDIIAQCDRDTVLELRDETDTGHYYRFPNGEWVQCPGPDEDLSGGVCLREAAVRRTLAREDVTWRLIPFAQSTFAGGADA